MRKGYMKLLILFMVSTLMYGCAAYHEHQDTTASSLFNSHPFQASEHQAKVNNYVAILDASSSMREHHKGQTKLKIGRDFLSAVNQSLPEVSLNTALRTFGHFSHVSRDDTALHYGPTQYSTSAFETALGEVNNAGGTSPIKTAIRAATTDLSSMPGETAIILVSDGLDTDGYTLRSVEEMKAALGSNVCINTVQVGNNPAGTALLNQISTAAGCGISTNADDLMTHNQLADYINQVLLTNAVATPSSPSDSDGDGVNDADDRCPNTPRGANVNSQGCWILGGILFDFDQSNIKSQYYSDVDEVATILANNPSLKVEIQGHTDTVGRDAYNMRLSERRAEAVMGYLVNKGIDSSRLSAVGFGESMPTVSNDTPEGRAQNRRVELKPIQ